MVISKADFGFFAWLRTVELDDKQMLDKLDRLTISKRAVFYCSGSENTVKLLCKAAKYHVGKQ